MNNPESNQVSFEQHQFLQQVHLSDYFEIFRKRKWVIIFSFLIIVGLVALYSFTATPIYSGTTNILFERPSSSMVGGAEIDIRGQLGRQDYFQVVNQLLVSRKLAQEVANHANAHFGWTDNAPSPGENPLPSKKSFFKTILDPPASPKPYYTVDLHLKNLQIEPVKSAFQNILIFLFDRHSGLSCSLWCLIPNRDCA